MTMSSNVSEIVERIRAKWTLHDFCGTALEDEWHERLSERAREFLTEEEHELLLSAVGGDEDKYHDAANEATCAVLEGFVRYLAGQHGIELVD